MSVSLFVFFLFVTATLGITYWAAKRSRGASAYFAAGRRDKAEEHLLASLEVAPGYRPAQKLLLELEGRQ